VVLPTPGFAIIAKCSNESFSESRLFLPSINNPLLRKRQLKYTF
jgi:hypothetical protein